MKKNGDFCLSILAHIIKLLNIKIMEKLRIYSALFCITFLIFFLPSCGNIDTEKVSPSTLKTVDGVLKDEDFIQLMNVRTVINFSLEIKSTSKLLKPLSEIKTLGEFESKVVGMGFTNLKDYNKLVYLEIYYLERLKQRGIVIGLFNEANRAYLANVRKEELKSLRSSKTCQECQLAYINSVYVLRENRDQTKNNCAFTRDLGLNACPTTFVPEIRLCIPNPFGGSTRTCFTFFGGYYPDDNCINPIKQTYDNCINNANVTYNTAFDSAGINLAICQIGCTQ
jgi:hypothetical protein